jgi:alkanesulfonate monooxygenase SsuD/methylene tetrahydromethanopterin reductase-like flavin-dependent oxidoreductase (luciferase family)
MTGKNMNIGWWATLGDPLSTHSANAQDWVDPDEYVSRAKMLERAGVAFLMLAEGRSNTLNPAVIASVLQDETSTLGLAPVLSSSAYPPFSAARLIATLDHMSGGRAGWGLQELLRAPEDPDKAAEFIVVLQKLWRSWQPDALIEDWANGIWADSSKVNRIDHVGEHFQVKGPLNTLPSPQYMPVYIQPVSDDRSLEIASRFADIVVVAAATSGEIQRVREKAKAFAEKNGRDRDALQVYFAVSAQAAPTRDVERPQNELLPAGSWPADASSVPHLFGTADEVSDQLEKLYDASDADGCVILGGWSWEQIHRLGNQVMATLRRRGRLPSVQRSDHCLMDVLGLSTREHSAS